MVSELPLPDHSAYLGDELDHFKLATNWKHYLASRMRPFISGDVLEVGAGLGANIPYLFRSDLTRWVSLEPDGTLRERFREEQSRGSIPGMCELLPLTIDRLPDEDRYDTILYVDVLEHIEHDRQEVAVALQKLRAGGHLIILCPAHQFLYSKFDASIGHFRRYSRTLYDGLSSHAPMHVEYLDSVGMLGSFAHKLILRRRDHTLRQILIWDRVLVRLSRIFDAATGRRCGKSILGIWRK